MTDKYEAPFEGGKTPDPSRLAKTKNRAKILARKAMKKAAVKEEVKPKSAQELNPGLQQKIDAASNAQKPRPLSGMRPIDKIKLMTRKEEVELEEDASWYPKKGFPKEGEYGYHPNPGLKPQESDKDADMDVAYKKENEKESRKLPNARILQVSNKIEKIKEAKDEGEYDYEGDMAMSQLKSVITNAQKLHDMLEPNTNLPEWVQSKITLAEDYIVTAANYMDGEMNEEVEQIDEVSIGTLDNYLHKRWTQVFNGNGFKKPGSVMKKNIATATKNANAFDKGRDVTVGSDNPTVQRRLKDRSKKLLSKGTPTEKMYHNNGVKSVNTNEEVEQIDELSKDFLTKEYGPKAMRAHLVAKAAGKRKTANKRAAGVNLASAKAYPNQFKDSPKKAKVAATNEETEQVEEGLVGSLVKAYVSPTAQAIVGKGVKELAGKFGASRQTQRRLQKVGMKWAKRKIGEEAEQIEEKKMGYEKLASAVKARAAKGKLAVEAHDPVGKEDADINNDGKTDKTDVYLHTKRRAIGKAINNRLAAKAGK